MSLPIRIDVVLARCCIVVYEMHGIHTLLKLTIQFSVSVLQCEIWPYCGVGDAVPGAMDPVRASLQVRS